MSNACEPMGKLVLVLLFCSITCWQLVQSFLGSWILLSWSNKFQISIELILGQVIIFLLVIFLSYFACFFVSRPVVKTHIDGFHTFHSEGEGDDMGGGLANPCTHFGGEHRKQLPSSQIFTVVQLVLKAWRLTSLSFKSPSFEKKKIRENYEILNFLYLFINLFHRNNNKISYK